MVPPAERAGFAARAAPTLAALLLTTCPRGAALGWSGPHQTGLRQETPSSSLAPAKPPAAGGAARAATRPLAPLLTPGDAARADFLPCLHTRAALADAASQAGTQAL